MKNTQQPLVTQPSSPLSQDHKMNIVFTEQRVDHSCSLMSFMIRACFCSSPEMWLTVGACLCSNRRSALHSKDRHRTNHLLCPAAVCVRGRIRHVQEEVRNYHILFDTATHFLNMFFDVIKMISCFFFLVKLKDQAVPSTPLQTQSTSVLMMVSKRWFFLNLRWIYGFGLWCLYAMRTHQSYIA